MSRLRQLNPQNYNGSAQISTEFESVIRYLNAAELGNKTIAELMSVIFDDSGNFSGVVELRLDTSAGLQYRVGSYTTEEAETGWNTLVALSEIRGVAGANVGEIGDPIFFGRSDQIATASQTDFEFAHEATDNLVVYVDGVLQREGVSYDYTTDPEAGTAGQVIFTTGRSSGETISIFKVREEAASGYRRQDTFTTSTQTVFPFVHDSGTRMLVYKNGILQREGGAYDYTTSPDSDTVTFTASVPSGNLVSIVTVESPALTAVTGLMLEEAYVNPETGLIGLNKIAIADDAIAQAKVNGLVAALAAKAKLTVAATAPSSPSTGDIWIDTSETPDAMKFYDGSDWLRTTPESSLPSFAPADANRLLRVNGTGTGLEFAALDLSSVIPLSQKAAANGVASLAANGRLTPAQRPEVATKTTQYFYKASPTNATERVERIWKRRVQITGISAQTSAGTCTVQIAINGVAQGSAYAISSVSTNQTFTANIDVDATVDPRSIQLIVSSVSAAADLEVTLTYDEMTV